MKKSYARATLSINHRKMSQGFNSLIDKLPKASRKLFKLEKFLYVVIAILGISWLIFSISSNFFFIKRIIAEQVCPLDAGMDGKIHGIQYLNPTSTESVFDCSSLDIVIASDGEVIVGSYKDGDSTISGDYGATLLVNNLTIEAGGKITATGSGYINTDTDNPDGNGDTGTGASAGGGGANGGAGGEGTAADPNPAASGGISYGNAEVPMLLGGSGGNSGTGGLGGAGGGAIKITASGTVTIDGSLTANGLGGQTDNNSSGGAGAGGSIWIESDALAGSGNVEAVGGVSGEAQYQGGGGGGGRIIMFCTTTNTFSGTVSVAAGDPSQSQSGGVGTLLGPTCRPYAPTVLKQYKLDQITELTVGAPTAEGQFIIAGNLVDPDTNEQLLLQVEVRPIGTSFTNTLTHGQVNALSNPQACDNGVTNCGKITLSNLSLSTEYHWQARVKDSKGGFSDWVSFGENLETERDILLAGTPYSIAIYSGNNQSGVVYNQLSSAIVVKVSDSQGFGIPGATVTWAAIDNKVGGTLLGGASTQTDADGLASNTYKLGQKTGVNIVYAYSKNSQNQQLQNSPVSFNLTGVAGDLNSFVLSGPTYSLTNQNFNLTITAYDQYNNIKTNYTGTANLNAVLSSNTSQNGSGTLSVSSYTFTGDDNGTKTIAMSYNTKESIKVKAVDGLITGYSNAIAIVDELGSCPDPDGIIDVNATWTADLTNQGIFDCRNVPEVKVTSNAILTLVSYNSGDLIYTNDFGVTILANIITVDSGSKIFADGKGYPTYRGPGSVTSGTYGASHGGPGDPSIPVYGSVYEPVDMGSGAGHSVAGGGAIKLVTGTINVNGSLTANGINGWTDGTNGDGGGSGGSIWIDATTINGSGLISTNGGIGIWGYGSGGYSGGGGRIAIYYSNGDFPLTSSTNIQSRSPAVTVVHGAGTPKYPGGPGTVYVEQRGVNNSKQGNLYVSNNNVNGQSASLLQGNYVFNAINVTKYGHLKILGNNSLLEVTAGDSITGDSTKPVVGVYGIFRYIGTGTYYINNYTLSGLGKIEGINDITIGNTASAGLSIYGCTWAYNQGVYPSFNDIVVDTNGTINMYPCVDTDLTYTDDYNATLSANNITINTGGVITSNYLGYAQLRGPGSFTSGYFGGAHGGYGDPTTTRYGDVYQPVTIGSGGGSDSVSKGGGTGGGAYKLIVNNTLTNNGTISANGMDGKTDGTSGGGGGAGGSIWIDTTTLNGSGVISTNGGIGIWGYSSGGYSGGGGRIAVYYSNGNFPVYNGDNIQSRSPAVRVVHGAGGAKYPGGPGTVYVENRSTDSVHGGTLLVNNNNVVTTQSAGLLEGEYTFKLIDVKKYGHVEFIGQNSILNLYGESGFSGDSTKPSIIINGTLAYHGTGTLSIEGVDITINGDITGVDNVNIGNSIAAGMTLYAHTWKRPNKAAMLDLPYTFGDFNVGSLGIVTLISYDTGDTNWADDYGIILVADNLSVASGGSITATGKGYGRERGPGFVSYGGGAHGGFNGETNATPYDSLYLPTYMGSGGGNSGRGGYGGGAVSFQVTNTFTNNGTIVSNGTDGTYGCGIFCHGGGGGAGGSILIDTYYLNGSGTIEANGGKGYGGDQSAHGSGGGGRISIYYTSGDYPVTNGIKVHAFGGNNYLPAGPGTVYVEQRGVNTLNGGILLADNNNVNAKTAGVVEGTYKLDQIIATRYGHIEFLGQDGILEITSGNGMVGDSTKPLIKIDGTLLYSGIGTLNINGVDLALNGDVSGLSDISIGSTSTAGMTLYANTWKRPTRQSMIDDPYSFGNIHVGTNGTITLTPYDSGDSNWEDDYGVYLNVDNLTIDNGGTVTASLKGYIQERGPGAGYSACCFGGGATYGGFNGEKDKSPFGSVYEPTYMGSGGAVNPNGGKGGGAFKINVSNTLTNNGSIQSNAGSGYTSGAIHSWGGGGGAGGSIWIVTNTINGTGTITADGGGGASGDEPHGSGSGGRIAVYYTNGNYPLTDTTKLHAYGGSAYQVAGAGTVYIEQLGIDETHSGTLIIDNNNSLGNNAALAEDNYRFKSIRVSRQGNLSVLGLNSVIELLTNDGVVGDSTKPTISPEGIFRFLGDGIFSINGYTLLVNGKLEGIHDVSIGDTLAGNLSLKANTWYYNDANYHVLGDVTVGSNGTISMYPYVNSDTDYDNDYSAFLEADNITVSEGGIIESDGRGYPALYGPGAGIGYNGGSYGGYEGDEISATYGNYVTPTHLGSGASNYGNAGGGSIRILSHGDFTNNGTISANGLDGNIQDGVIYDYGGGGSSGGSILINTNTLNGSGYFKANGGLGKTMGDSNGSGGGGGRIAIYYASGSYPVSDYTKLQAYGGANLTTNDNGGPGTIYIKHNGSLGDLIINNNGVTGQAQNMLGEDYRLNTVKILGGSIVNLSPNLTTEKGTRFILDNGFELDSTSVINGIGKGFPNAQGPGKGNNGVDVGGGGGGAHGGSGGASEANSGNIANGGIFYGDQTRPITLGSGGGNSGAGTAGGYGGGAIAIISQDGYVNISGTIDVSGTNGLTASPGGGGGAGGSILILTQSCDLTGELVAEGGGGGDDIVDGGGGGGGRVSILVNGSEGTCDNNAVVSAENGVSTSGQAGQPGTYPGTVILPQVDDADQYTTNDDPIPVGGRTNEKNVKVKIKVSNPGASLGNPKRLKAQIEIAPQAEEFSNVLGTTTVVTNSSMYYGGEPIEVYTTVSDLLVGESYKWQVRVIDETDSIYGEWSDYGSNGDSADFTVSQTSELRATISSTSVNVGEPLDITVTAYDSFSDVDTNYTGIVDFSISPVPDYAPDLPTSYQFDVSDSGTKTFNDQIVLYLAGTYRIVVTDRNNPTLTGQTEEIIVSGVMPTSTPVPSAIVTPGTSIAPTPTAPPADNVTISNVTVTLNNNGSVARVCWNTNIPTISNIDYGLADEGILTSSSTWTTEYSTQTCITLSSLTTYTSYIFRINANSQQGKTASYDGGFTKEGEIIIEPPITDCIDLKPVAINNDKEVILQYSTVREGICKVDYGTNPKKFNLIGQPLESIKAQLHESTLGTSLLNDDLYYSINCLVDLPTGQRSCTKNDSVSYCKFGDCLKIDVPEGKALSVIAEPLITILPVTGAIVVVNMVANSEALLYGFLMIKKPKRTKPWGIIFDKNNQKPVAFAVVRVVDKNNKLVKQDITDSKGRYGFVLDPGEYTLIIEHTNYAQNSQRISIRGRGDLLAADFGIEPKGSKRQSRWVKFKDKIRGNIEVINTFLVFAGLSFSVIAFVSNPVLLNIIILGLYLVQGIYIISTYLNRSWGLVVDAKSNKPVQGAFVRLFDVKESRQIDVQITDEKGRYRFKVTKGNYLLKADANGYSFPSSGADDIFVSTKGERFMRAKNVKKSITNKIGLDKRASKVKTMRNPFD